MRPLLNALTVDVEEHFQVSAFSTIVPVDEWDAHGSRVADNCAKILRILDRASVRATFFFLGWIAERQPGLVSRVHGAGHEVATHGFAHRLITQQTPEEFERDVRRSLLVLQDITGAPVLGYRAPSFSITRHTSWALDILGELGLRYDSSVFPIHHDLGGCPGSPRHPYPIRENLWEIPPSTWRFGRWNLPIAGGGYLRLYPYRFTRWAIRRVRRDGLPVVVYTHPWEYDPEQPRIDGAPWRSRFRHYQNLDKSAQRLSSLVDDFDFVPMCELLAAWGAAHDDA